MDVLESIFNKLSTDSALIGSLVGGAYTGILQGGIWNRPLKREGPAATLVAFYDSSQGKNLRPSAVVLDGGAVPHFQRDSIPHAYETYPKIYLYAQATEQGKTSIKAAHSRIYDLLNDWYFTTDEGTVAFVKFGDRTPLIDSEEFKGGLSLYCRYVVTSRFRSGE